MKPVRDQTVIEHYLIIAMNVFFSILNYKQHVTVKHITATRLLDIIPRLKGHKSARTPSLGCQSMLVYAAVSVCVDCAAGLISVLILS